jgi:hypothetical protein
MKLGPGRSWVKWFNPRNGEYSTAGIAEGATWTSPAAPDNGRLGVAVHTDPRRTLKLILIVKYGSS